jgi:CBS domain-containing protein
LLGVVTRANLLEDWVALGSDGKPEGPLHHLILAYDLIHRAPITAFPWESCRVAAERMAQYGVGRLPVVSPGDLGKVVGIVSRSDLLKARAAHVEEEAKRERFIGGPRPEAPADEARH